MTQKQKKDNIKMKKIIIITGFILLLFIISAILSATIFYFQNKNNELPNQNNNILYYNILQNYLKSFFFCRIFLYKNGKNSIFLKNFINIWKRKKQILPIVKK